jgi:hypothetical protein
MDKAYLVFGILICGLFFYASSIGWQIVGAESISGAKRSGPSYYHK